MRNVSRSSAAALSLAAFTLWVLADTCLKFAGLSALPAMEMLAIVGFTIALLMAAKTLAFGHRERLRPKRPALQVARSLFDLVNNLGVIIALRHLPLALFYILVFLAPLTTTLLAAPLLGESLEWKKSAAILAGFAGVVIAVNPLGVRQPGDWIGLLACMLCVTCFTFSILLSRRMSQTETPESLTFVSGLVMFATGTLLMLGHAKMPTLPVAATLAACGACGVVGAMCFFIALKCLPAADVMQFHYSQLLTGALLAWLLFRERPTPAMWLGAPLIVAAGIYTARANRPAMADAEALFAEHP